MKKRYRVTVKAVEGGGEREVGSIILEAHDRDAASQAGLTKLWTKDLEASGARAETHVERIAGEGG